MRQKVIQALGFAPPHLAAGDNDSAISNGLLLPDLVVRPSRCVNRGQDVDAAGVGLGQRNLRHSLSLTTGGSPPHSGAAHPRPAQTSSPLQRVWPPPQEI